MKKIVAALFAASLLIVGGRVYALASDHFGELNLKGGVIIKGASDFKLKYRIDNEQSGGIISTDLDHGFSFALEYLIPCSHFFSR
ncbi:MAG: hypothetical protein LBD61_00290 [Endomicrobium sp.]|jgi:hypothetical protein|nr:hypothetical protein [Endomicrobium sp.]